jgi:hypothetical protein
MANPTTRAASRRGRQPSAPNAESWPTAHASWPAVSMAGHSARRMPPMASPTGWTRRRRTLRPRGSPTQSRT